MTGGFKTSRSHQLICFQTDIIIEINLIHPIFHFTVFSLPEFLLFMLIACVECLDHSWHMEAWTSNDFQCAASSCSLGVRPLSPSLSRFLSAFLYSIFWFPTLSSFHVCMCVCVCYQTINLKKFLDYLKVLKQKRTISFDSPSAGDSWYLTNSIESGTGITFARLYESRTYWKWSPEMYNFCL